MYEAKKAVPELGIESEATATYSVTDQESNVSFVLKPGEMFVGADSEDCADYYFSAGFDD